MKIRFDILTIFPHIFDSYINESLLGRAQRSKLLSVHSHDLRDYLESSRDRVDDRPFGGGPGMVLKVAPIYKAVSKISAIKTHGKSLKTRVVLFSARGKTLNANISRRLSGYDRLILICGHYEGVDERVAEHVAHEEISIGDYVLSGGELPALVLIDAVSRFLPGFLGKRESLEEIKGSYPVYTRPAVVVPKRGKKWNVPDVLVSGDHAKIRAWRGTKYSS